MADQDIESLKNWRNSIIANAKETHEFPELESLNNALIRLASGGKSYKMTAEDFKRKVFISNSLPANPTTDDDGIYYVDDNGQLDIYIINQGEVSSIGGRIIPGEYFNSERFEVDGTPVNLNTGFLYVDEDEWYYYDGDGLVRFGGGGESNNIYTTSGIIRENRSVSLDEGKILSFNSPEASINLHEDGSGLVGKNSEVSVGRIVGADTFNGVSLKDDKLEIRLQGEEDGDDIKIAEIRYDKIRQLVLEMEKSNSNTDHVQKFQSKSGIIALLDDLEELGGNEVISFDVVDDDIELKLTDNTTFTISKSDLETLLDLSDYAKTDDIPEDVNELSDNDDLLGDKNVQSDLSESDEDSDSFVKNKGKLATKDKVYTDDIEDEAVTPGKLDREYAEKDKVILKSEKGEDGGVAPLNSAGKIPSRHLPEQPSNVLIEDSYNDFPNTGEENTIYIDRSTGLQYVWDGNDYVQTSTNLSLGETSSTAYRGDRGKEAYEHSKEKGTNPHEVTKSDVGLSNVVNKEQLGKDETAADSNKLGGKDATEYPTKTWVQDKGYLTENDLPEPVDISGKEDTSNKATNLDNPNNTKYPTTKAVSEAVEEVKNEFIEVDSINELRNLDSKHITQLSEGKLKYVRVLGYYEKGDTPAPIHYYISDTNDSDNGGSVIESGNIKLEHEFKTIIDIRYFGAQKDQNIDGVMDSIIDSMDGIEIYIPVGTWYVTKTIKPKSYSIISGGSPTSALSKNHSIIRYNGSDRTRNDFVILAAAQSNIRRLSVNGGGKLISGMGTKGEFTEFTGCIAYRCEDGFSIFGDSYQSRIDTCYAIDNTGRGVLVESRDANASGPQAVLVNDTYSSKNKIGMELGGGSGNTVVFSKEVGANTENNIKLTEGNWRMMGSAWAEPPSSTIPDDYVSVLCENGTHTMEGDIYSTFGIKIQGGDIISNSPQYRSQYPMKSIRNNNIVFWYSFDEISGNVAKPRYGDEIIDIGDNEFVKTGQFGTSIKVDSENGLSGIDPIHCDFRKPMEILINFRSLGESEDNFLFTLTGILPTRYLAFSFFDNKVNVTRYNGENSTTSRQSMYVSGEQNWISVYFDPDADRVIVSTMGGRAINVLSVKISSHLGSGDGSNNLLHIGIPEDGRMSEGKCKYEIDEIICFDKELSPTEKSHFSMMAYLPKNKISENLDSITKQEILDESTEKRAAEGKAIHEAIEDITENKQFSISSNTNISSAHNQATLFIADGKKITITPSNIPEKFECFVNNNSSSSYVEISLNSASGWTYKVNNKTHTISNTYVKESGMVVIMRELEKKIIYVNGDIDED